MYIEKKVTIIPSPIAPASVPPIIAPLFTGFFGPADASVVDGEVELEVVPVEGDDS